jgi:NAD(P)-dependent dehydrogenase (short-subunit alcohol dehydrogenase family)
MNKMNFDLKNRTILVTGASDGIGYAIAEFLMKNGARVAVHYNSNKKNAAKLINAFPQTNSKCFKANLAIENEVINLYNNVIKDFNKIDGIVLNAGVYIPHSVDEETKNWLKTWNNTIDINLTACGILTKLGIEHFKQNKNGRFIYISSRASFKGETAAYLAYAASKGGLNSLARTVARSFGKDNIKSFIIAPGFTKTKMAESYISKYGDKKILDEIALNELTSPADIAPLVTFILNGYLDHATGTTIDLNAGSYIH